MGSASDQSSLLACQKVSLVRSTSVDSPVGMSASVASASSPRPSPIDAYARTKVCLSSPSGAGGRMGQSSARGISEYHAAPRAARMSKSGSGCRSESRPKVARRITTRTSSRSSAAASQPRPVPAAAAAAVVRAVAAHLAVERMRHTHFHATVDGFDGNEATHSASSIAAGSVIVLSDANSIGSPKASTSITSLTGGRSTPIRDSMRSTKLGATTGSPIHPQ